MHGMQLTCNDSLQYKGFFKFSEAGAAQHTLIQNIYGSTYPLSRNKDVSRKGELIRLVPLSQCDVADYREAREVR